MRVHLEVYQNQYQILSFRGKGCWIAKLDFSSVIALPIVKEVMFDRHFQILPLDFANTLTFGTLKKNLINLFLPSSIWREAKSTSLRIRWLRGGVESNDFRIDSYQIFRIFFTFRINGIINFLIELNQFERIQHLNNLELIFIELFKYFLPFRINRIANF